ncbi:hypothetical protein FRC12_000984 [Ceratobasidium sp. 428]|nr:hypothetical protein FRC12_000984 [Ceratobasidium sp. 428]
MPSSALEDARHHRMMAFRQLANLDFAKQLKVFATNGCSYSRVTLLNGDVIVPGDCVEIDGNEDFSKTSEPGEKWIAEVCEIKAETKLTISRKRWLKCRWFYTEKNLQNYKPTVGNLSSCNFGENELVLSNHEQIFSAESILRKTQVKFFDEFPTDADQQVYIGEDELWYRYALRTGKGATDNRLVLHDKIKLPPAQCGVPKCRKRYDPTRDTQRFCPREGCRVWYHTQCLENVLFRKSKSKRFYSRLSSMLKGLPEFDDVPDEFLNELEKEAGAGSTSSIIWCAKSPISRGCDDGIVGNEEKVRKARDLIKEIWDCRGSEIWLSDEDIAPFADTWKKHLYKKV